MTVDFSTPQQVPEPRTLVPRLAILGVGSLPGGWSRGARVAESGTRTGDAACLGQARTLGATTLTPERARADTVVVLTVTAAIGDPKFLPGSANLQRLEPAGTVQSVLGTLPDAGPDGDAVAGARVCTLPTSWPFCRGRPAEMPSRRSAGLRAAP